MLPISAKSVIRYSIVEDDIKNVLAIAPPSASKADGKQFDAVLAQLEAAKASAPVFLLAVPSLLERAAFQRDLMAAGIGGYPSDAYLYAAARADLERIAPRNLDDFLAVLDAVESAPPETPLLDADRTVLKMALRQVRAAGGAYAALEGDRAYWLAVAPLVACRHFLIGWENWSAPFDRRHGQTSDDTLALLSDADRQRIGNKIFTLLAPSADILGNSASPSPSPSGPKPSTRRGTRPRTVPAGKSPAKSTRATRRAS